MGWFRKTRRAPLVYADAVNDPGWYERLDAQRIRLYGPSAVMRRPIEHEGWRDAPIGTGVARCPRDPDNPGVQR